ncbi:MAG: VOC family protein [Ectothiorhodospiraceae bacterium]|nr:VOC family protein [Ectothiorhodospiraceae bacterium]MCH8503005.1 VOC family protein [Ectothiorhodospiraceae bacterium]
MKLWSGVVTAKLAESRDFYIRLFGCKVLFDSDWFVLLELGGGELGLLAANLESQAEPFRAPSDGTGLWVVVDVDDARAEQERLRAMGVPIMVALRDEPWGDRHFVVRDPNGVAVDVVEHRQPQ